MVFQKSPIKEALRTESIRAVHLLPGSVPEDVLTPKSMEVGGHGTATKPQAVNVVYGTSDTPPDASTVPEGTVYIKYTA